MRFPLKPAASSPEVGRKVFFGWWIVLAALALNGISGGVWYFGFSAFLNPVKEDFGVGSGAIAGAFGVATLVQGVGVGPLLGLAVDRVGPRRVMLVGISIVGLGFVLLSRTNGVASFYLVLLALVGPGILMGTQSPAATAVANWFDRKRGTAFGILNVGFGVSGLMVVITERLVDVLGWRTAATIIGITLWVVGFPLASLMRHRPEQYGMLPDGRTTPRAASGAPAPITDATSQDFTVREAIRTPTFWLLYTGFSLRTGVSVGTAVNLIPALEDKGISSGEAAFMFLLFGIVSIPFRLASGRLLDVFEKRYVAVGMMAFQLVAMFLYAVSGNLGMILVFVVLFAAGSGGVASLMQPMTGDYFGRKAFASIMGIASGISVAGMASFPPMAGAIRDATGTYNVAFLVFGIATAVAMVILFLARPPVRQPVPAEAGGQA